MRLRFGTQLSPALVSAGFLLWAVSAAAAQPISTALTYQGQLSSQSVPQNGVFDIRFRLYDSISGVTQVGPALCAEDVTVQDGRFTVVLDFGSVFSGNSRFLEIDVREDAGDACASGVGYQTLAPRQPLTATPYASYALGAGTAGFAINSQTANSATTANNSLSLNNQPPSFYTNASNISSGILPDTRLSSNIATLNTVQTFSGTKTFNSSPSFSSAGVPFSVSSTTKVTNLNADLLDGIDSTGFALANHTHSAAAITSGTLLDARLSSNVPLLASSNIFTASQEISTTTQTPLTARTSNTGGTWTNFINTSSGGRTWNLISTGSGNGEGAGKLLIRDQNASSVRLAIDTSGQMGIGTVSPSARLELFGADTSMRIRNVNDTGGGYIANSFATLQIGMFNPTALPWGVVPGNSTRAVLGVDNTGRVGSLINIGLSPTWRNLLDDGTGLASFERASVVGSLTYANQPRVAYTQTFRDPRSIFSGILVPNTFTNIDFLNVTPPSNSGFLLITATVNVKISDAGEDNNETQAYFKLEETTGGPVTLLTEVGHTVFQAFSPTLNRGGGTLTISWVVPVTSTATRSFRTALTTNGEFVYYHTSTLNIVYIPRGF